MCVIINKQGSVCLQILLANSSQTSQRLMKICQVFPNSLISKLAKEEPVGRAEGATKFYLRRPNKQTTIVYERSRYKGHQLLDLVQQKMQVKRIDLVLFLKGDRIQATAKTYLKAYQLKENDIVHVHNSKNSSKSQLNIMLKPYECPIQMEQLQCVSVKSDQKIGESLKKHIQVTQEMAFVESGRVLDLSKTFKEESIEDESEIIITTFNTQKIEKQKKQSEEQPEIHYNIHKQLKPAPKLKSIDFDDLPKPNLRKSMTWSIESCNLNLHELNFKKKKKPSIYKSMKIMDGKQIVWQSDGSADLSGNLRQKMPIRRHNKNSDSSGKELKNIIQMAEIKQEQQHMMMESDESSDGNQSENLFSSSDRKVLKNQLNKLLFSSDNIETEKQVTKLQPPQMLDDDFLEETEEIEIVPDDQDEMLEEQQDEDQQKGFKAPSMDLRQSIGKSRGQFVLPMIPTRDFDMKDDSDSDDSDEE